IIAPGKFKHEFSNLYSYRFTYESIAELFQWVLIHKGKLHALDSVFLKQTLRFFKPVFANEVFVVFSSRSDVPHTDLDPVHLEALLHTVHPPTSLEPRPLEPRPLEPGSLEPHQHLEPHLEPHLGQRQKSRLAKTLLSPLKRLKRWFADPRLDGIANQLDIAIDRLSTLEKDTRKLRQEIQTKPAPARNLLLLASMTQEELRSACRAACQTAYLGNDTILCRVLGNYLLYGDTKDIGIVPHLCLNGFWEPWITLAMLRTIKPGWHCLDIGANHGYYTLLMSSLVGAVGRVVALEPNDQLVQLVHRTLEVNGFVDRATAISQAVSDQVGQQVQLVIPSGHTGHASLHYVPSQTDQVMQVETTTVDQLTAEWAQVDLIKIDVEGAEYAVWQGMQDTIYRNKEITIVLEFGAARYANARGFLEEIVSAGFKLRYVDYDSHPKELSIERCLTERPNSHWDLFLSRQ
ncbi:MAG TPA: FkbM family methyltransferase, partial [Allocoleopsis sp.]